MTLEARLRLVYDEVNNVTVLELPYSENNRSMLIFLPDQAQENNNNNKIAQSVANIDLSEIRQQVPETTRVIIPRFKIKFQTFLKGVMENMGVTDLFGDEADLTGISDEPLYVTEGIHQAFIEVSEEGTEAGAATAIIAGFRSARKLNLFRANYPFIFIIYDFNENIPLFAGKLVDPSSSITIQQPIFRSFRPSNAQETTLAPSSPETTTTSPPTPIPNTDKCPKYVRIFANALDNTKICEAKKNDTEWNERLSILTETNAELCSRSEKFVEKFYRYNCQSLWCERFLGERQPRGEEWTNRCSRKIPSGSERYYCTDIKNHLSAITHLGC
jgi:hypothetical protein